GPGERTPDDRGAHRARRERRAPPRAAAAGGVRAGRSMTLAIASWGEGPPLALLHGFTGSGGAFDHLRVALGRHFGVIAPDLPGHGKSPLATGWDDALEDLRAALPRERVFLAGYSMGARLALAYALRHPSTVKALVLESGLPGIDEPGDRERRR